MSAAGKLALMASGGFLLAGLLLGIWKYRRIMTSPNHRAPVYVDIAHRAALMYSFASLVMMTLLIVGEIGGILVLFWGFLVGEVLAV